MFCALMRACVIGVALFGSEHVDWVYIYVIAARLSAALVRTSEPSDRALSVYGCVRAAFA